ncbi:MAG: dethiobiotin synthetase [Bradymonadia bacterium]
MAQTRRIALLGTDTDVGKTWVGVALARHLVASERTVAAYKPIESGTDLNDGIPADATAYADATGQPLAQVCPWPLPRPVAPAAEIERLGMKVTAADIEAKAHTAELGCAVLLMESAGGVLSPLTPSLNSADLAGIFDAEAILVARSRLGVMSHVATCVEALLSRNLRVAAIVLNEHPDDTEVDHDLNAEWLDRLCPGIRVVRLQDDITPLAKALRLT